MFYQAWVWEWIMLQKCILILSSLIYQFGICKRGFYPVLCLLEQLFISWPTAPGLIVFLTQCEFPSWHVWFVPEPLLLPRLRVGGTADLWGGCLWLEDKVLSGCLICCRLSVNDVRQIRGQLIPLGSGTFCSLELLAFVRGFWMLYWPPPTLSFFEKNILMLAMSFGNFSNFYWLKCPLCERNVCWDSIVRGQILSSQENDEAEERETGSTEPTDSVRRLGSLLEIGRC